MLASGCRWPGGGGSWGGSVGRPGLHVYWNLKNGTEMLYGVPVRVLSVASCFHWSGMLLVSYYDHSGSKNAAGWYPMTHT